MNTIRIVLQETVSKKVVYSAAWNNDWSLIETIKADGNTPHEVIWQDKFQNVNIHYIEDFHIDLAYIVLRGEDLAPVVEDICAKLPIYTKDDVFKMLENSSNDQENLIKATYYLGLMAPQQFSSKFFTIFKDLLP